MSNGRLILSWLFPTDELAVPPDPEYDATLPLPSFITYHNMGAFSTCKWDGTIQFTKSGPIAPRKCTVSAGRVIALMFGILAGILLLIIIGLHFRQRRTVGPRDVSFTDEEELEQLLPHSVRDSEDQSPLPLPPVPPKDKDGAKGTFPEDSLGYGGNGDEPPPPYIKE